MNRFLLPAQGTVAVPIDVGNLDAGALYVLQTAVGTQDSIDRNNALFFALQTLVEHLRAAAMPQEKYSAVDPATRRANF